MRQSTKSAVRQSSDGKIACIARSFFAAALTRMRAHLLCFRNVGERKKTKGRKQEIRTWMLRWKEKNANGILAYFF